MPNTTDSMKLVIELSALHSSVLKRIESQLSIHGISFTEFLVMHQLFLAPTRTLRRIDLAESVGLSASGVTRVLKPMEKIHLVEKESNPRDARVSFVKLSGAGEVVYRDAFTSVEHSAQSLAKALSKKQLSSFLELVATLK
ncbi:MAG: MarR family transcriptional regulator [Chromatiales bacterium]|nr:MarR family transcriptional regulator [Chromatiales bacterium]